MSTSSSSNINNSNKDPFNYHPYIPTKEEIEKKKRKWEMRPKVKPTTLRGLLIFHAWENVPPILISLCVLVGIISWANWKHKQNQKQKNETTKN